MAIYAVTYDLNKNKDYQKLWDALDKFESHKAAKSFYLVRINNDKAEVLKKHLEHFIDDDDILIVIKFKIQDISTHTPIEGTDEWIKRNS